MEITSITVSAGRTFNHPYESFSNLRSHVELKAEIFEGDDPEKAIKELQAKAEKLVEDHKQATLKSLYELQMMDNYQRKVSSLETSIRNAQSELDCLRNERQELNPEKLIEDQIPY